MNDPVEPPRGVADAVLMWVESMGEALQLSPAQADAVLSVYYGHPVHRCPDCKRVSHNPNDARHRYCGACHRFQDDDRPERQKMAPHLVEYVERLMSATSAARPRSWRTARSAQLLQDAAAATWGPVEHLRTPDDVVPARQRRAGLQGHLVVVDEVIHWLTGDGWAIRPGPWSGWSGWWPWFEDAQRYALDCARSWWNGYRGRRPTSTLRRHDLIGQAVAVDVPQEQPRAVRNVVIQWCSRRNGKTTLRRLLLGGDDVR